MTASHPGTFLLALASLLAFSLCDLSTQSSLHAQTCPPEKIVFKFRDGTQQQVWYCYPPWQGITGDEIAGGGDVEDAQGSRTGQIQPVYSRSKVRNICWSDCPQQLPAAASPSDVVVWNDGKRTTGRIQIRCDGYFCRIDQDGVPRGPDVHNGGFLLRSNVAYIELAESEAQQSQGAMSDKAYAQARAVCEQDANPDRQIVGCTAVIEQKREPKEAIGIAHSNRGAAYTAKGDQVRALDEYNDAVRLSPDYLQVWINRGNAYFDQGDDDRALADYSHVVEAARSRGDRDAEYLALLSRGATYAHKREFTLAQNDFSGALTLRETADAHNEMARAFSAEGRTTAAHAHYEYALKIDPTDEIARKGRDETAALLVQEARTRAALLVKAKAELQNADDQQAIADYSEFLRLLPSFPVGDDYRKEQEAYVGRATAYLHTRDFAHAAADFDLALIATDNKRNPDLYKARGQALLGKGEPQKAYSDFEKALRLAPDDAEVSRGSAEALAALVRQQESMANNPSDLPMPQAKQDPMTYTWDANGELQVSGTDIQSASASISLPAQKTEKANMQVAVYYFGVPRSYSSFRDADGHELPQSKYVMDYNKGAFHVQGEEDYQKTCGKPECPYFNFILLGVGWETLHSHTDTGYKVIINDEADHRLTVDIPAKFIGGLEQALAVANAKAASRSAPR